MSNRRFLIGFLLAALLIAGAVSYLASSSPDGLDHATLRGCEEVDGTLVGDCIAQDARDHDLADGPLADYAVAGAEGTTGVAGVIGVVLTLAVAGGLFWVLRRRTPRQG
ncbi:PDGLE domain-containing protein [Actinokineospora sp. 24-640]